MNANSQLKVQKNTFIQKQLLLLNVEKMAHQANFYKACARKVTMTNLMLSFFQMALTARNGYQAWALYLGRLTGQSVSKVAIWKRTGREQTECLRLILEQAVHRKLPPAGLTKGKKRPSLFSPFHETYLQDSTIISLPDELGGHYKGSVSRGKQKSSMRLQATYALNCGTFKEFSMDSFTQNDQGASGRIVKLLKKGDLVIRDLGYFSLKVFGKIAQTKAFFLTRYRYGVSLYHAQTGEAVNLNNVLRGSAVDMPVMAGQKEKLPCRLVAVRLPDQVAAQRRRTAKNDRDKRLNHSSEYMQALSWAVFITNIDSRVWGPWEILMAYRLRWHIEVIFKGWKSHLNMESLVPLAPRANRNQDKYLSLYKYRVDSSILMMLIFIIIFQVRIYTSLGFSIWQKFGKQVSCLKLYDYIAGSKEKILQCISLQDMETDIAYYATYEKRRKRLNHLEILYQTFDYQQV